MTAIYLVSIIGVLIGGPMIERWKPVLDYEDLYQVSDRGRVRRIVGASNVRAGHILRPRNNRGGYPYMTLSRNGHRKTQSVHTLVAQAFLGPRPAGLQVNHKNGVKTDNRVTNLEYLTPGENTKHSYTVLGHEPLRGEAQGQAKLTDAIVREIRRCYAEGGVTQRELAERYGVTRSNVCHVLSRKTWAHVA